MLSQDAPNMPEDHSSKASQFNTNNHLTTNLLKAFLDTNLVSACLFKAVREEGVIKDFEFVLVNSELERETGRTDLIGKYYAVEYAGIKKIGLFDAMLAVMQTGLQKQIEYFYPYDGFNKWFSCTFVKSDDGLIMTCLDISRLKQAEEEKINLIKNQNRTLFWANLNTQEIERKRISEGLHNSIGQLLFGIKLLVAQPINESNYNLTEINSLRDETARLVEQAIKETRNISHELSPGILEDFGLQAALEDICSQFKNSLDFDCSFIGIDNRLNQNLELAIYRMAQELILNVIKHSKASHASLMVQVSNNVISLVVQDNGIGFDVSGNEKNGIGLRTIKNKVKLLNGSFEVKSLPGINNSIAIYFPHLEDEDT